MKAAHPEMAAGNAVFVGSADSSSSSGSSDEETESDIDEKSAAALPPLFIPKPSDEADDDGQLFIPKGQRFVCVRLRLNSNVILGLLSVCSSLPA